VLEEVIAQEFGIAGELRQSRAAIQAHEPVFEFKKQFVQKRARKLVSKKETLESFAILDAWVTANVQGGEPHDRELAVARFGVGLLGDEKTNAERIERLASWCAQALSTSEGQAAVSGWMAFNLPHSTDHAELVPVTRHEAHGTTYLRGPEQGLRRRDGFKLNDRTPTQRAVLNEIHYCVLCHDHAGDFCSRGFPEKKTEPEKGLKHNPLGVTLTGCPLDEKISEMHTLKKQGYTIGALAMIMADNPMCPATGHRICNDCMKACIYQKQDPVNIPQVETRCLIEVLELPWGVEIYDLLTQWNPLRAKQWLPKPYNGLKVMICGLGPAGFTLAHHLLMEGCAVVGVDGMKIEPLPAAIVDRPVERYAQITEPLDRRTMAGFGGVAESGITVRWDKNFLRLIYLSLVRRKRFQLFGNVRFGGTVTVEDAWHLGFDHLAIAVGSGLPQALPVPGSLAIGMRQANDFLMALQLTGAGREDSLSNLQIRLPAVVIGGGLTALDTATEVHAYYIVQVEKTLARYETLARSFGEAYVRQGLDQASLDILEEFLAHAREIREERQRARAANEDPNFVPLLRKWGGVTVVYRRGMRQSPAYTRNHEELIKALEEGIEYAEGLDPRETKLDQWGHVEGMVFAKQIQVAPGKWEAGPDKVFLPARSVLVATGARPNVAYEFEHKGHFRKEQGHYQPHVSVAGELQPVPVAAHCKEPQFGAFTSYRFDNKRVTYVGDTHPAFHGSVVGAIASALRTYPKIMEHFAERAQRTGTEEEYFAFRQRIQTQLDSRVERVTRLNASVVELTVRAPLAAKRYQPGQFFRVQTYETCSPTVNGTTLQTEVLALTGSQANREQGTVALIVHEHGASARIIGSLQAGDPIALMGPTGVRARIAADEIVLIITEGFGHAHLRATGATLRARGSRVIHVALFDSAESVYLRDDLEAASDATLWVTARGSPVVVRRAEDCAATGEFADVLRRYAAGEWGAPPIALADVQQIMIQASSCTVRAFKHAYAGELKPFLTLAPPVTAAVNTPIQCGLKGVCAQCLHYQIDPNTGLRTKAVFGCSWQDQPLEIVDLDNLDARLSQNRLQEHLSGLWLDYVLLSQSIARNDSRRERPPLLIQEPHLAEI
jgi:NADPH-dependent glutamate synthase beta subunit-like oxidoreductase/NAD(P)H-flavin reductase